MPLDIESRKANRVGLALSKREVILGLEGILASGHLCQRSHFNLQIGSSS
jgi:hypothetical protein